MRFFYAVILSFSCVLPPCTCGQPPGGSTVTRIAAPHYRAAFFGPFITIVTRTTGAPYSAEQTSEGVEVLTDGSRVLHSGNEFVYRDSQGRIRIERRMSIDPAYPNVRFAQIVDPVEGNEYFVDTVNRVAHRIKILPVPLNSTMDTAKGVMLSQASIPSPLDLARFSFHGDTLKGGIPKGFEQTSTEALGERVIEGILVRGEQRTLTYTANSSGHDRPPIIRTEAWVSDAMKLLVLSKRSDTSGGSSITRMFNWSTAEPDPALFPPLAGYTVVDEKGPFKVDIAIPAKR